jgi:hypothetical protein
MSKKTTKQRNKQILKNQETTPPPLYHSEGHWEDFMLENNSYYDVDIIAKANKPINKKIKLWEGKYAEASSWLGKWYCQIRIDKLKEKLHHYENKS